MVLPTVAMILSCTAVARSVDSPASRSAGTITPSSTSRRVSTTRCLSVELVAGDCRLVHPGVAAKLRSTSKPTRPNISIMSRRRTLLRSTSTTFFVQTDPVPSNRAPASSERAVE